MSALFFWSLAVKSQKSHIYSVRLTANLYTISHELTHIYLRYYFFFRGACNFAWSRIPLCLFLISFRIKKKRKGQVRYSVFAFRNFLCYRIFMSVFTGTWQQPSGRKPMEVTKTVSLFLSFHEYLSCLFPILIYHFIFLVIASFYPLELFISLFCRLSFKQFLFADISFVIYSLFFLFLLIQFFSLDTGTRLQRAVFKRLPFTHCALSLLPFEDPVCTPDGIIFDLTYVFFCSG